MVRLVFCTSLLSYPRPPHQVTDVRTNLEKLDAFIPAPDLILTLSSVSHMLKAPHSNFVGKNYSSHPTDEGLEAPRHQKSTA